MKPAPNLVLVGPMGAGKTSIGRRLAERLDLAFADIDREVETHAGTSVATIFECEGEAGFRARESAALAEALAGEQRLVATGGGAVLADGNRQAMRERGFVVHLHLDLAGQLERLARDKARPLLQRADREDVLRQLARVREPLYAEVADLRFDTAGMTPAEAALALVPLLAARWQRPRAAASREQA